MDKVKQLEKYIEPLRRMITKIGTDDQVRKYQGNFMCHDSEDGSCKRDITSNDEQLACKGHHEDNWTLYHCHTGVGMQNFAS